MSIQFYIIDGIVIIAVALVAIYYKVRGDCIKKASEYIAKVETNETLSGKEKFMIVLAWIDESLPKILKASLFKRTKEKIAQLAFDNSSSYAANYIKRKTGMDISALISTVKTEVTEEINKLEVKQEEIETKGKYSENGEYIKVSRIEDALKLIKNYKVSVLDENCNYGIRFKCLDNNDVIHYIAVEGSW